MTIQQQTNDGGNDDNMNIQQRDSNDNKRKRKVGNDIDDLNNDNDDIMNHRNKDVIDRDDKDNNNIDDMKYIYLNSYGEHKRAVSSVKFAPHRLCKNRNGNHSMNSNNAMSKLPSALIASASADGTCKLWDYQHIIRDHINNDNKNHNNEEDHNEKKETIDKHPTTPLTTKRTSVQSLHTYIGHSRGVNDVCWNTNTPLLATASDDKTIRIYDAITCDALIELRGHDHYVFCLDQHGDTNLLVSGSFDETIKIWDIRTAQCISTIPAHSDPITGVTISRDGTTVASSSHDGLIRIWDTTTCECLKTMYALGNPPVSSIKYSSNNKFLLANTLDSTIRLWPIQLSGTNRCSKTYHDNGQYYQTILSPELSINNNRTTPTSTTTTNNNNTNTTPSSILKSNKKQQKKQQQQQTSSSATSSTPSLTKKSLLLSNQSNNQSTNQSNRYHINTKYSIVSDFMYNGDIITGSESGNVLIYDLQYRYIKQVLPKIHNDVVLAVSSHTIYPIISSGGMTYDKKVEFYIQKQYYKSIL